MKIEGDHKNILKKAGLKNTSIRQQILGVFMNHEYALSYNDIEKIIDKTLDKVSVYRTLKSFEEKGLIHRIIDDTNQTKYALCTDGCGGHGHRDSHVHFKCQNCGYTFCLTEYKIPSLTLPEGYLANDVSLLVHGLCQKCNG